MQSVIKPDDWVIVFRFATKTLHNDDCSSVIRSSIILCGFVRVVNARQRPFYTRYTFQWISIKTYLFRSHVKQINCKTIDYICDHRVCLELLCFIQLVNDIVDGLCYVRLALRYNKMILWEHFAVGISRSAALKVIRYFVRKTRHFLMLFLS